MTVVRRAPPLAPSYFGLAVRSGNLLGRKQRPGASPGSQMNRKLGLTWFSQSGNQMRMLTISQLSAAQLREAAEVQTKIEALQAELAKVLGGTSSSGTAGTVTVPMPTRGRPPGRKQRLSAAGRARIIAASKAYWASVRAGKNATAAAKAPAKKKRTMSPAARARLAAFARARWAKIKASGKRRL